MEVGSKTRSTQGYNFEKRSRKSHSVLCLHLAYTDARNRFVLEFMLHACGSVKHIRFDWFQPVFTLHVVCLSSPVQQAMLLTKYWTEDVPSVFIDR